MEAILTLKNRNSLVDIHEGAFLAGEIPLGWFAFKLIHKNFDFIRPFNCIL